MTSETVKKYGLASNNESYVINALQFVGVLNDEGKRTEQGSEIFSKHDNDEFKTGFEKLVRNSYKELFELHGDGVWELSRNDLIGYFRTTDKTSDVIGGRQAGVFKVFAALAGHGEITPSTGNKPTPKPKATSLPKSGISKKVPATGAQSEKIDPPKINPPATRDMALTVRIEINLPTDGTRQTYDNIFQSIKANLLND